MPLASFSSLLTPLPRGEGALVRQVVLGLVLREASMSDRSVRLLVHATVHGWSACRPGLSTVIFLHVKETYMDGALALAKPSFCPMPVDKISAGAIRYDMRDVNQDVTRPHAH